MPNGPEQTSLSGQPIPPDGSGVSKSTLRRVVGASFIGNFVEWFDYAVYGYLAVTISAVFFPEADKQTALLLTFGLFAISFFVRPIGGFIWGHIGDRVGRKNALSLSILIMSAATFAIGLIPDYGSIGIWAPIMLLHCHRVATWFPDCIVAVRGTDPGPAELLGLAPTIPACCTDGPDWPLH